MLSSCQLLRPAALAARLLTARASQTLQGALLSGAWALVGGGSGGVRAAASAAEPSAAARSAEGPPSRVEKPNSHGPPLFGELLLEDEVVPGGLDAKDRALVQLYTAGTNHYWDMLPGLAQAAYDSGASDAEVWGTVRHLIVFAGYAPCLAATIHLQQAGMLHGQAPGKVSGPPGDAFELVYDKVTDKVREKLHHWDPVLSEYIRLHLYGDVYSSPGLGMRQKQMLTVAFLGEANMHDQLYTHAIAALRFGVPYAAVKQSVRIGFHMSGRPNVVLRPVLRSALRALDNANAKFVKDNPPGSPVPPEPTVTVPDASSVRVPPLPPPIVKKK